MIGKSLSPILEEIEHTLWEYELNNGQKPNYTIQGFRASVKIFMSTLLDKSWELQENENISSEDRMKMAESIGTEIRKLIKTYTDIDTVDLYKDLKNEKNKDS